MLNLAEILTIIIGLLLALVFVDGIRRSIRTRKNKLKVDEQELKNEIQKQVQSMPDQQKQLIEYYQKNPSAALNLRGAIYEEKIINLIKQKSKKIKKTISIKDAKEIIHAQSNIKKSSNLSSKKDKNEQPRKAKKAIKSSKKTKKIRKK